MKIVSIVGARPQFIKASQVCNSIRKRHREVLVHTGQHYDGELSDVFFKELNLPKPDYYLGVGSGLHGEQTGEMLSKIEKLLISEKPDWVIVYGDTNTTLAGALAASKLSISIAHVEAGLRSFNRDMPEEINRIVTDHLSDLLFCPSRPAVDILANEGITEGVRNVGDVMSDALMNAVAHLDESTDFYDIMNIEEKKYLLATVHRAENTDNEDKLVNIFSAFASVEEPILFPAHPRTKKAISIFGIKPPSNVKIIPPLGYLDFIRLEKNARMIITDSGGIQKEAYWLKVPCVTLRNETEWVETVDQNWNTLVGSNPAKIVDAIGSFKPPNKHPQLYGDGHVAERITRQFG